MYDRTTNSLLPINNAAQDSLKVHGNAVPNDFYGGSIGKLKGKGFDDIISFKPPDPLASPPDYVTQAKYDNAVEMFEKRLHAFGEQELVAAKPWLQSLPGY